MIIYFADRNMNVIGKAFTDLREGFSVRNDEKVEDIESGVSSFSCDVVFEDKDRLKVEEMTKAGNYLLRKNEDEAEFYTIIDSELDSDGHEVDIYAEDAGLDLLNEIAGAFEATEAHPIAWYVDKWAEGSGFEIGINEIPDLSRKLKWDGEATVTERLRSVATQFDNAEIGYSFDIEGLTITHKYINIYKKRGKDIGTTLKLGKELENIVIKRSVANLATALMVTGGIPDGKEDAITLKDYKYDDGDFYVDSEGVLKSRRAVEKWSRYAWEAILPNYEGHIVKTYSYDTTSQETLCKHAVTALKAICDMEVNYEVDIIELPRNVKIGDRVNIVDDRGKLYVSARLLELKSSITAGSYKGTFGEYLIKDSGVSSKVEALAKQFTELAKDRAFYTWIAYADDEQGTGISLDPTGKQYIGISANRLTEQVDTSDPSVFTWSVFGGKDGEPGVSLSEIVEHYLISELSTGVTINTEGWSESAEMMTPEKPYLWNYETLKYSDGHEVNLDPKIIGTLGEKGDEGEPSPKMVMMTEQYYLSESAEELTGGTWLDEAPTWEFGKSLWIRWKTKWDSPNPDIETFSDAVLAKTYNDIFSAQVETKTELEVIDGKVTSTVEQVVQLKDDTDQMKEDAAHLNNDILPDMQTSISQISQNAEEIEISVSEMKTTVGDVEGMKSELTKITGMLVDSDGVSFNFSEILSKVLAAEAELKEYDYFVNINKNDELGATITIGDSETGMVGRFTKTSLDFLFNGEVVASYGNEGLTTDNVMVKNQVKYFEKWATRPGKGDNLNDVWTGG